MTPAIDTGGQAPPSVRNLDRTSLPGGDPNAPAATPQPGTQAAADLHHGALGEIFQTLAGGKKKEWQQTPQGPVATYRDLKPGEMARGILAAAITGLAGGYDPENRGKGPAMASAFSGGFKANEKRVEKQQGKEEGEAQEQFKNEGLSQERALRLHQDAREQMKSIEEATNSYQENRLREVQIAMGQHNLDKDTRAEQAIKTKEWENHVNFDTRVVDPTTKKPVDFVDQNALQDFANAHPEISIRHGKYDTVVAQDPVTGHWTLFQKPWDIDRPQWLGVEVKEDGTPKKDAKGEMIIDKERPALDENGKPFLPTSPISERDFRAMNQKAEETQAILEAKRRTAEESAELAQDRKEKREASDSHKLAMDHYNAAGGDLKLTDDRGRLIVTPSDALEIRATLLKNHEDSKATWQTAQKELDNMTDAEKKSDRGTQTKGIADAAQAEMIQSESLATALISPRNPVALLVEKQRKAHTDAVTGKVDIDAAEKDMKLIPKPRRDEVLEDLKKSALPSDPLIQKTIEYLDKKVAPDKRADQIADAAAKGILDAQQAADTYKHYGLQPPPPPPAPKPESAGASEIKTAIKSIPALLKNKIPILVP
jgi:hypothetical protein